MLSENDNHINELREVKLQLSSSYISVFDGLERQGFHIFLSMNGCGLGRFSLNKTRPDGVALKEFTISKASCPLDEDLLLAFSVSIKSGSDVVIAHLKAYDNFSFILHYNSALHICTYNHFQSPYIQFEPSVVTKVMLKILYLITVSCQSYCRTSQTFQQDIVIKA